MTIEMYSTQVCSYCHHAKRLLEDIGLPYTEINIGGDPVRTLEMMERSGGRTVPQIFIDGRSIGGYTELAALAATGQLA